jgi:hypothetical protein
MGQNNRARRAAKQRKRQRAHRGRTTGDFSTAHPDVVDLATHVIGNALQQHTLGGVALADGDGGQTGSGDLVGPVISVRWLPFPT